MMKNDSRDSGGPDRRPYGLHASHAQPGSEFRSGGEPGNGQQTLNPDASLNPTRSPGLDGVAANAAIDNYRRAVQTAPEPARVINIGGDLTGSN